MQFVNLENLTLYMTIGEVFTNEGIDILTRD